ncbi:MAG: DUF5818 domain-containing protein [Candidatus Sulfotelmatobacter sp.]
MTKQFRSSMYLGILAVLVTVGISLQAQQNSPQNQPADPTAQQPATPPQGQAAQSAGGQTFTGTITKSGDKFVFQDTASGNTYDIDHQEQVSQFEGKKVRVHGTLDANGKMIHLQ